MSSIVLFDDKKDCCGCGACMNVCPKNAIRMAEDEVGFVYPEIDQNLCVGCGACKKACGYQTQPLMQKSEAVYAAASNNDNFLRKSASGGAFAVLAENVLKKDGVVYGAALPLENGKLEPKHASGVVAIISIINVLIGSNLFYNLNTVSRNVLMVSTVRMGIIRAEATFGHPVYYAMYCALIIPLALYVWQNEKNAWNSCVLGLNVIAAFLTESRGTIVVLLALFLVYVIIADKKTRNRILTAVCAIACVAVVVSFVVPTVAQQFSNIIKSVMIAFGDSSETIENFGGNSSTGLSSRMIQLSGISWMLIHNAVFGLGASCHTRGKLSYRINGIWQVRDTIDNGYVGYFVEEGLLGGIACFSLFYSLLKSSWKKATFKNSRNMNNSFFLCFVSYVAVMLSVADVSQLLWVIIALYITYNAKAQAIASE